MRIGGATLEITDECEPCDYLDTIRMGLQVELQGRRGVLCRVVEGGRIGCSDSIELVEALETVKERGGQF
jgi:MOSC domain-containing protein YiiM